MTDADTELQDFAGKLFDLARAGDLTLLDYVSRGVNVNLVNQSGDSFLMLAAYKGNTELVQALIAAGADPQAGQPTALDTARMFGREDLVTKLAE